MEIRVNPNAKKIIPAITAGCILFFLFIAGNLIRMKLSYRDFVPVEATITDVTQHRNNIGPTRKRSFSSFVVYEYSYNGKKYSSEEKVFTRLGKEKGEKVELRCSPSNPAKLEDIYMVRVLTIGSAVLLLCSVFLVYATSKIMAEKKKKRK